MKILRCSQCRKVVSSRTELFLVPTIVGSFHSNDKSEVCGPVLECDIEVVALHVVGGATRDKEYIVEVNAASIREAVRSIGLLNVCEE